MDLNDGHPPDASEALWVFDSADKKQPTKKVTKKVAFMASPTSNSGLDSSLSPKPNANELISYKCTGRNSCFLDVGLALWLEAYWRWPPSIRKNLLKSIPTDTVLSSIFNHYDRQIKWLATGHGGLTEGQWELLLGQKMTQHGIFNRLKLCLIDCINPTICFSMGILLISVPLMTLTNWTSQSSFLYIITSPSVMCVYSHLLILDWH